MKIIIFGSTGFIGKALCSSLESLGHSVLRRDLRRDADWQNELQDCDGVVNLAGTPIFGKRWNDEVKKQIHDSRVVGTHKIVAALGEAKKKNGKVSVFVNASAIGYYGDSLTETFTETSPSGKDFLAGVCAEWESAAAPAEASFQIRTACIRTGIVLGRSGGALAQLIPPFKVFGGGPIGNGTQWSSWIHLDDVVGLIEHALTNTSVRGPLNAVSPNPVSNAEFSKALGKALHRPSWLPLPPFALYLIVGQAAEILVKGQKVLPKRALETGYKFKYPGIDEAMKNAV